MPTPRHSADEYQHAVCSAVRLARFGGTDAGLTRARIAILRLRRAYDVIPGWADACDELLRLLAERRRVAVRKRVA